jgi:hypothetical protein
MSSASRLAERLVWDGVSRGDQDFAEQFGAEAESGDLWCSRLRKSIPLLMGHPFFMTPALAAARSGPSSPGTSVDAAPAFEVTWNGARQAYSEGALEFGQRRF